MKLYEIFPNLYENMKIYINTHLYKRTKIYKFLCKFIELYAIGKIILWEITRTSLRPLSFSIFSFYTKSEKKKTIFLHTEFETFFSTAVKQLKI